jgi:hypothetical protein
VMRQQEKPLNKGENQVDSGDSENLPTSVGG